MEITSTFLVKVKLQRGKSFQELPTVLMVTGDQCMRKWTKLENKFKETEDHNNQTGNDKRKIKFYDELFECIGSDPNVTPVITLESDHGTGSADIGSTEHSDSEESSGSAHVKGKRPTEIPFISSRDTVLHARVQCQTRES